MCVVDDRLCKMAQRKLIITFDFPKSAQRYNFV